jgi:hypothetical protein
MKRLPKYTPAEVRNDPYGFTYKEMSEVIGENEAKALYEELYKQLPRKKNLSMLVKNTRCRTQIHSEGLKESCRLCFQLRLHSYRHISFSHNSTPFLVIFSLH